MKKQEQKRQNNRGLDEKINSEEEEKTPKKDKNWDPDNKSHKNDGKK